MGFMQKCMYRAMFIFWLYTEHILPYSKAYYCTVWIKHASVKIS